MNWTRSFFLLVFFAAASGPAYADNVSIAASAWPPYTDENLPQGGVAIDLVATAFKRAGYQTSYNIETWPRTLEGVDVGVYDVVAAAWFSEARGKRFLFSEPYLTNRMRLIGRKGRDIKVEKLEDLRGLRVGVVRGYAYGEEFQKADYFTKVYQNHVIQNLLLLTTGKVDVVVGDEFAIRHQLRDYMPSQADKLEFLPKAIAIKKLHIAVSRDNPRSGKLIADFNKAIAAMRQDGTYRAIVDKHLKPLAPGG